MLYEKLGKIQTTHKGIEPLTHSNHHQKRGPSGIFP